jgi:heme A synthase
MIILAGLIGGLLVTRGLSSWLPFLQGTFGTLLALVLAGASIFYQGGFLSKR